MQPIQPIRKVIVRRIDAPVGNPTPEPRKVVVHVV